MILIFKQTLEMANDAWERKNMSVFIELIDRIGSSEIPESYRMKYNIAIKTLSKE